MRLRECREAAKLSQKFVAITLGVAPPSVSNWETGKTRPTRENLVRMADLYGVSVDYLLGRTDDMNEPTETSIPTEHTPEAIAILGAVDKMPAADRRKALELMKVVFTQYEDFFIGGD